MAVLPTGIGPVTGYNIERSLRFNSADSAYLNRTPGSASNRKTWTYSAWIKRTNLSSLRSIFGTYVTTNNLSGIDFTAGDAIEIFQYNASYNFQLVTTPVFRDPSSWYHIVVAFDTTQATDSNRIKLYVNGTQITVFATASYPSLNYDAYWNNNIQHDIARRNGNAYWDGYQTEVNFIDGQALTPSSFGETDSATGVWKPKAYSGTYGTNGFFLKFADNSGTTSTTLGKDSSGNGNNWTPNNFSVTAGAGNDSLVDSPTNYGTDTGVGGSVRGNYATLNPINKGAGVVLTNGSLDYTNNATNRAVVGTIAVSTGKYYWEVNVSTNSWDIGVCEAASKVIDQSTSPSLCLFGYSCFNGNKYIGASKTASSYDTSGGISGATVLGFAVDFTTGTATIYRDNVSKGVIHTWTPGVNYVPYIGYDTTPSGIASFNFGQRPFAYTAPSGFKALCTTNLPTPTIGATSTTLANKYFDINLWTGTGSAQSLVNSGGFQPDFVWGKIRSGADYHVLSNAIAGADKFLKSNTTDAETTNAQTITSFNSNGFSVGTSTDLNRNTYTFVGWQWNAGGSNATNTSGTITSTVRANTTSGFSIVTYTGTGANATVGHGLGVAPSMIIVKNRAVVENWPVYHVSTTATGRLILDGTAAFVTTATTWNSTAPTSTVFSVGSSIAVNGSGNGLVAYCFAPVAGYSAFGSYTGNGSTDGPFVYTNFRPRWIMYKRTDTSGSSWVVIDTARDTYNYCDKELYPNLSNAENTGSARIDILSNGYKIRSDSTYGYINASGGTYIYMALAESPFKYSLGR